MVNADWQIVVVILKQRRLLAAVELAVPDFQPTEIEQVIRIATDAAAARLFLVYKIGTIKTSDAGFPKDYCNK